MKFSYWVKWIEEETREVEVSPLCNLPASGGTLRSCDSCSCSCFLSTGQAWWWWLRNWASAGDSRRLKIFFSFWSEASSFWEQSMMVKLNEWSKQSMFDRVWDIQVIYKQTVLRLVSGTSGSAVMDVSRVSSGAARSSWWSALAADEGRLSCTACWRGSIPLKERDGSVWRAVWWRWYVLYCTYFTRWTVFNVKPLLGFSDGLLWLWEVLEICVNIGRRQHK